MTSYAEPADAPPAPTRGRRPSRWWLSNWPVSWKVLAIALVPLVLAATFGALRISDAVDNYRELRLAADRVQVIPAVADYVGSLENAILATATGDDPAAARGQYDANKAQLQQRLDAVDLADDVRGGTATLLRDGQRLLDQVSSTSVPLRQLITSYAPILLTAEDAINGSVRLDDAEVRADAAGVSRAVGARGQMFMQKLLLFVGGQLSPEELRISMVTLAGTEPSTLFGMSQVLGVDSDEAKKLQQQMLTRMDLMSNPTVSLAGNPELLQAIQVTEGIATQVIERTGSEVTTDLVNKADAARGAAFRDVALVLAVFVIAMAVVFVVARSLVRPLRILRSGALRVAHEDLVAEVERVRNGEEPPPIAPIPVHTSEEIGQVAHAVDELHEQALLLAGDQAQLQAHVDDMFETLSRRNRSLVDQQVSVIDRLERDEQDPERLEGLFRLDHLAARMRRNGANLLVLAGAKPRRDAGEPVAVADLINAAASQVEDYPRVVTTRVPDAAVDGSAAGDVVHLLAELIDNALRYSPPGSEVEVSAVLASGGGLIIEITDSGIGMTEADLRIANTRLQAGGEVTPYTARHMGLFVVGRLARQHGLVVRLRAGDAHGAGTTAGVFVPAELILDAGPDAADDARSAAATARTLDEIPERIERPLPTAVPVFREPPATPPPYRNGTGHDDRPDGPLSLPRRSPGASGITGIPNPAAGRTPEPPEPPAPQPAPEPEAAPAPTRSPSDTSAFFSSSAQPREASEPPARERNPLEDTDVIYQRMVSEWLIDLETLTKPPQSWESVWDNGWAAAEQAAELPVEARTEQGLPVRAPGARLVPGSPEAGGFGTSARRPAHHRADDDDAVASGGGSASYRDPEAVRASLSSHMGGVRAGRTHARHSSGGMDDE
ncbi:ATP-binding protein [Mycobacterium sp. MYCO198283]|uniref:ATP-binding protein n=1 Tax=Mycobacterium sp. MYCO198283 TaxID=2883505 RepID=UPI001E50FD5B|nr:ATP-binding protein [Mycobacterium sp. MYCO198283]MCG5431738.1 ATP-binding protein [Mycobacterium sp. MYCO198283]